MRNRTLATSLSAFLIALFSGSVLLAADSWLGTWILNAANSRYSPGPAPKSGTAKFETSGDAITLTTDGVSADGKTSHGSYTSKFDGTESPWTGNADADTAAPKRIDANTFENASKKAGKVTITSKVVVSKDGKTLTVTQTGKNAKGESVNNLVVYNRQ